MRIRRLTAAGFLMAVAATTAFAAPANAVCSGYKTVTSGLRYDSCVSNASVVLPGVYGQNSGYSVTNRRLQIDLVRNGSVWTSLSIAHPAGSFYRDGSSATSTGTYYTRGILKNLSGGQIGSSITSPSITR